MRTWVLVIFDMITAKNGIAAREVERKYGVSPRTAWHMLHRIRQSMGSENKLIGTMRGTIISDETYIGGNPQRMNAKTRRRMEGWDEEPVRIEPGAQRPNQLTAKLPVLSLVNAVTGEVRSKVIPNVTGSILRKVISEQVDMANSALETDEGAWYGSLGREFAYHSTVNHSAGEYVRKGVTTNMVEGFFSQLKRSIDGTHHHVSREHLHRYLGEFDFRYSTCKMSDYGRMRTLAKLMEGRLSYKRLVTA